MKAGDCIILKKEIHSTLFRVMEVGDTAFVAKRMFIHSIDGIQAMDFEDEYDLPLPDNALLIPNIYDEIREKMKESGLRIWDILNKSYLKGDYDFEVNKYYVDSFGIMKSYAIEDGRCKCRRFRVDDENVYMGWTSDFNVSTSKEHIYPLLPDAVEQAKQELRLLIDSVNALIDKNIHKVQ